MGNNQSGSILSRTGGALDTFVTDLGPNISYDKSLGSSRFIKTIRCRHKHGYLVVKIFIKTDSNPLDEKYLRRLKREKKNLQGIPNVYPYQVFYETDKAGYMIRQWVASSLYDRISTRPFLTAIEKRWIVFQLLSALRDCRAQNISHGDIKSENVLVTSWNYVYLTDFASFKPVYLPLDNPSDFAFYYDTSGRRNCYIAPERFYTVEKGVSQVQRSSDQTNTKEGKVTEAMDIFSAGCVVAELFFDGAPMFTLSQLFKYREGELNPDNQLAVVEDPGIRDLIRKMIALSPSSRPSFAALLQSSRGTIFPECFYSPIYELMTSVSDISSSSPFVRATPVDTGTLVDVRMRPDPVEKDPSTLPTDSDRRVMRVKAELDTIVSSFKANGNISGIHGTMAETQQMQGPNTESSVPDGPAIIILSFLCANIRNCILPGSKIHCLDILLVLSYYINDEAKLDRLVPYVLELTRDECPLVRAKSIITLRNILQGVTAITPFNAEVFSQYILPSLRESFARETDVMVRSVLALNIAPLATLSISFLEMAQTLRIHGASRSTSYDIMLEEQVEASYDSSIESLQKHIEGLLSPLLVDQASVVKRAAIYNVVSLCVFFGRQKTNDLLLSHMITYLNDRDWQLRYDFFNSVIDVATCLGGRSLEEYILPLMVQALADTEETVVAKVLSSLSALCELGLFQRMRIWELLSATLILLYHPNTLIVKETTSFVSTAMHCLSHTDKWCIVYPSLRHFLKSDPSALEYDNIINSLKTPISRSIYDFTLEWMRKPDNSLLWRTSSGGYTQVSQERIIQHPQSPRNVITLKSIEGESFYQKLTQLGITTGEEAKLVALQNYISKLSASTDRFQSQKKNDVNYSLLCTTDQIKMQQLQIIPQTIFINL